VSTPTHLDEETIHDIVCRQLKQIAPETDPWALEPDADVRERLDIDSFDALNFLIALDEALGIEIPEKDYGKLTTMEEIVTYLSRHLNE
jgi:acyl carrier protein